MSALSSIPFADQAARLRYLIESGGDAEIELTLASTRRAKVITISSGKGGVGKTNLAVNLAIGLQSRGVRTTLIDLDLGLANADLLCGLNPATRIDRAVVTDTSLEDLSILAPGGFRLVPGSVGLARQTDNDAHTPVLDRLHELDACSDVLILDTGAGMGHLVRSCLRAADLALLVATPEPTSIADAYALLKVASATHPPDAQFLPMLVINQCATAEEAQQVHGRITSVATRFLNRDLPLLAALPNDPALPQAVRDRRPLLLAAPAAPAALAITAAAEAVISRLNLTSVPMVPSAPEPEEAAGDGSVLSVWRRLARLIAGRVD